MAQEILEIAPLPPPPMLEPRRVARLVSIVIPVHDEEAVLPLLRIELEALAAARDEPMEWIVVDDGSCDATWKLVGAWAAEDGRVQGLKLSRNFGHQAAVTAGLDFARGDAVVVMDADLQDPPHLVHEMLDRFAEGYDVVYAQRLERRGETLFKRGTAAGFYWLMRRLIHKNLPQNVGDFRLMSRAVLQALGGLREGHRFLRGMVTWVGYRQTAVSFVRPPRAAGSTKYPLLGMIRFAQDAIFSFSSAPLRASGVLGLLVTLGGFGFAGYVAFRRFVFDDVVPGHTALVTLECLLSGFVLLCLGVVGEYIGRIYDEIKQRPLYLVERLVNARPPARLPPRTAAPLEETREELPA